MLFQIEGGGTASHPAHFISSYAKISTRAGLATGQSDQLSLIELPRSLRALTSNQDEVMRFTRASSDAAGAVTSTL